MINVITGPATYLLMMTGNERYLRNYMIFFSLISMLVLVVVAYIYGVKGAALSVAIVGSVKNLGLTMYVRRVLDIRMLPALFGRRNG